jgi:hypothetical protein
MFIAGKKEGDGELAASAIVFVVFAYKPVKPEDIRHRY